MRYLRALALVALCAVGAWGATPSYQPVKIMVPGWIGMITHVAAPFAFSAFTLDNDADSLAFVFPVEDSMVIVGGMFRVGTVTSAGDARVRLERIGTRGAPEGTLSDAFCSTSVTVAATDAIHFTFTDGDTVGWGDTLALVIVRIGSANFQVSTAAFSGNVFANQFPCVFTNNGGAGYIRDDILPNFGIRATALDGTDLGMVFTGGTPLDSLQHRTVDSTDNPDEIGIKFQNSAPTVIRGINLDATHAGVVSYRWALYDDDTTTLADAYLSHTTLSASLDGAVTMIFDECPCTLAANTTYRITQAPLNGTDVNFLIAVVDSSIDLNALPSGHEFGRNWHMTSRWIYTDNNGLIVNKGAWVDDTLRTLVGWNLYTTMISAGLIDEGGTGRRRIIQQIPMGLFREATETFAGAWDAQVDR